MYKLKFNWSKNPPQEILEYMQCLDSHNAPIALHLTALLPVFGMASGFKSHFQTRTLNGLPNIFMIWVANPAAGKSSVYHHILKPCLDALTAEECLDINPQIELQTTADAPKEDRGEWHYMLIGGS